MKNSIILALSGFLMLVNSINAYAGKGSEFGLFYDAPDGVKVIAGYNSDTYGKLYRMSRNLYVQTKSDAYLSDMSVLIRKLQLSQTGREILRQIATYTPVNAPNDGVAPLIEHTIGVDQSKATIVTVIREPEGPGRLFETIPSIFEDQQKASLAWQRQFNGKGVSNTVYFSTTEIVNIPGKNTPFDQTVALGHELIHARDFASGAVPQGSTPLSHRHPDTNQITEYVIPNYEYQTTGITHYNNAENGRDPVTEISSARQSMINLREDMYFHWKALGQEKAKAYLKNEKVVSEFHLADDLGKAKRNTYWPKEHYDYQPYALETRPSATPQHAPNWDTVEGKMAHIEVRQALKKSLSEGNKPAIVIVDATEQRLSQSLQNSPALTRRGLGNQSLILKYAAQNDIKVVNIYSKQNETPLSSLKKRKKSLLYRSISGKQADADQGYSDVQYSKDNQSSLVSALEENDDVLVMAYSDGKMTTNVIDSLSESMAKEVIVSRYANLDYQPSNLSAEESTAWKALDKKGNVKMLGGGSRSRFNICSIQ
ncbi:M91 family zinc metallopeptidase [Vibrio splendidus]|nr:M91 family zinc metallopeptidase [Vibrio splendidus]MCC4878588.1 type III secretion system effector protein [Vibrio splendidus]